MKITRAAALAAIIALSGLPFAAGAAETRGNVGAGLTGEAGVGSGVSASTSVSAGVSAHGTTGSSTENGKGAEVNGNAEGGQETAENARMENGAQVALVKNAAGVTVTTPAQVSSDEDLGVFAQNVRAKDEHVASANATAANAVEVAYRHRAYLFGFIPVMATVRTHVSANASGTAKVVTSYPWWDFLASGDAGVASDVDASLQANASVEAVAKGSASAAEKAAALQAVIDAHAQAAAKVAAGA